MNRNAVGQFDFDDGGTYCGGSEGGKAHGFGVCTGPGGHGEYCGGWQFGFELSGVYTWPNGNDYAGQWMQGKRHGLGVERRGHWKYRGEWTQGFMGRYGIRESTMSEAKYEGTWTSGLHDGYGLETYSDGGTYQGQWMKGVRHGYGVRKSAFLSKAALCPWSKVRRSSLTSVRSEVDLLEHQHLISPGYPSPSHIVDNSAFPRIGFFLKSKNQDKVMSFFSKPANGKSPTKQVGTCETVNVCQNSSDNKDELLTETYIGEWKNDKRSGFGVCERSDGLKYEGEWSENTKTGYGISLFPDGAKEEGKYKNNILLVPNKKMLLLRATKIRERIDLAVAGAQKAAQIALQKSDIANSRMESARSKAELAREAVDKAKLDSEKAKLHANDIIQSQSNSGQMKVATRHSIPRHNLVDNKSSDRQTQSIMSPNHFTQESQSETKYNETKVNSQQHPPASATSLDKLNMQRLATVSTQKLDDPKVTEKFIDEPECFPVNQFPSTNTLPWRASEQMSVLSTKDKSEEALKSGSQSMLTNIHGIRDLNEVDHLAEIEDIFSYLADEEKNMDMPSSTANIYQNIPESQHILSRPSLRYRRDVRCPNLVIANHDSNSQPAPLKRRLTMPCILKYGIASPVAGRGVINSKCFVPESMVFKTIVIDNGVRKHLEEELEYHPPPRPRDPVEEILEPPKELAKRYRLESVKLRRKPELGSLPNVSFFKQLDGRAIPRNEAEMLCQQKKKELQQIREIEDELRKKSLVLKIGDIKDWCRRRGLSIVLIALNLVLVILFFKLLS